MAVEEKKDIVKDEKDPKDVQGKKKPKHKGKGKGKKGGKPAPKGNDSQKCERRGYDNDVSWYAANEDLVKQVASLATVFPLGSNHGLGVVGLNTDSNWAEINGIPGITSLEFMPTYGQNSNASSALNIAIRKIYQEIRQKNSGYKNYEAADLGSYLVLMDSIYSLMSEFYRAVGCLHFATPKNVYLPKVLVEACGFPYDELSGDLNKFMAMFNRRVEKINSFAVPNEWNIMVRHAWLNLNIFADDEDLTHAQLYVFKQMVHNTWKDYDNAVIGPYTSNNKVNGQYATMATYFNRLDNLIDNVYLFDDASLMSGDILKAYEDASLIKFDEITEDYTTTIAYSKEVLQQIKNTVLYQYSINPVSSEWDITQAAGGVFITNYQYHVNKWSLESGLLQPQAIATEQKLLNDNLLYLDDEYCDPKGIMVASRNICLGPSEDTGGPYLLFTPDSVGSEVFFAARLYTAKLHEARTAYDEDDIYVPNCNVLSNYYFTSFDLILGSSYQEDTVWLVEGKLLANKFSYFPRMYFALEFSYSDKGEYSFVMSDLSRVRKFAYIPNEVLSNIHDTAVLSLVGSRFFASGTAKIANTK